MNEKTFVKTTSEENETSLSSTKLTQTSKGTNIEVKVYDVDPEIAAEKAVKLFESLRKRFPPVT